MCNLAPTDDCYCKNFLPNVAHCPPTTCHHQSAYKIRLMLAEPLTQQAYDVHKFYLRDFIKDCPYGFYVYDLANLTKIFELLAERLERLPLYKPYFKKLLEMSAMPPLFHDSNDKITGGPLFSEFLTVLGLTAIWLQDPHLRRLVYKALMELLTNQTQIYLSSANFEFRINAVESSHLPEIITQLLEIAPKKEYLQVLNIAESISKISSKICRKMLVVDTLDFLLLRLLPENVEIGYELFSELKECKEYINMSETTCHILLNVIRSLQDEKDENVLNKISPCENSMWAVRYVFRILLYGHQSRFARNNLMEFILRCLHIFPYLQITECGLAGDLAELSVATEINESYRWMKIIKFIDDDYDITFKQMLLLSLCYMEKYPLFQQILESRNVIPALVKLSFDENLPYLYPEQHFILRKYALNVLYYAAPVCYDTFLRHNGPARLLKRLESFVTTSHYCRRAVMRKILKILNRLMENEHFIDYMKEHNAFDVFKISLVEFIKKTYISYSSRLLIAYSFHMTSLLYNEKIPENDSTIEIIISYFQRILDPNPRDACFTNFPLIAALDLLWIIIKTSEMKLKQFIKMKGVYLLLDMLEKFPFPVKLIGLGVLVDICEEKLCLPFLLTWRGGPDKKCIFFSLLARLFRKECNKIGTWLNSNDIIMDLNYPLMGKIQIDELITGTKNPNTSSSIADMLGSARPKIYAILQLLSTRYETEVDVINDHYKIANISVPRNDVIILHLAKNYFALKLGESWNELTYDFAKEGIEPVAIDAELLYLLMERMSKWNSSVKEEQEAILKVELNKEITLEEKVYSILKECKLQGAIDALRELAYFARAADKMFRTAHKKKQIREIEKTSQIPMDKFMKDINITAIYNMQLEMGVRFKENT